MTNDQVNGLRRVLYGLYLLVYIENPLLEEQHKPDDFCQIMKVLAAAVLEVRNDIPLILEGFKGS